MFYANKIIIHKTICLQTLYGHGSQNRASLGYKIIALNPNSSYHLSLKISYPNEFDVLKATQDGRKNLGDNIFIHGSNRSIGCIAIGNNSIEELFVLIAKIGKENVSVIIAPNDIRKGNHQFQECNDCPKWINELYYQLDQQIKQFR